MKTVLTLSLLLASQCLYAQNESRPVNYECMERNCVTTPPVTIGNPDGFDWQGLPPGGGVRYPANGLQRRASDFPIQVVNGDFNLTTGWDALRTFPYYGSSHSTLVRTSYNVNGAPPAAALVGSSMGQAPFFVECPNIGLIRQKIHVGRNKRLSFDWQASTAPGANGVAASFGPGVNVVFSDAYSGHVLNAGEVFYQNTATGRHSEVDLSAFAGLDVEIRFNGYPVDVRYVVPNYCSNNAWVDSVAIIDGPVPTYTGAASAGNWYNPSRSGSGWDLRRAPDGSYYAIWYTYDSALQPIWYITSAGAFVNGRFQASLLKCTRTSSTATCPAVGRVDLTLKNSYQGEMRFDFANEGVTGQWDGEEYFTLLTSAGGAYSGHFHSNDAADPAWGITTMSFAYQNQQKLFATMYYYNGSEPTWAVGTGTVGNNTAVTMMRQSGGLCPQCVGSYPAITQQSVGSMNLNFTGFNPALIADLNISSWLRPTRPYYMLSN